jgi:hypothetical protein
MDLIYLDNQVWWDELIEVKAQSLEIQMQVLHRTLQGLPFYPTSLEHIQPEFPELD